MEPFNLQEELFSMFGKVNNAESFIKLEPEDLEIDNIDHRSGMELKFAQHEDEDDKVT